MPAQPDVGADAALILAALGRMEAVIRDERAAFTRLRVMLGDMAEAIARGKTVADSETATTLLDELEHRVDAMLEIAGPGPAAAAAAIPDPQPPSSVTPDAGAAAQAIQHPAEHDQVPTVSDVVSQLGSDDETPPAAAFPPVDETGIGAPTVAMLTAMVEALRDSISPTAPEPEAALEQPETSSIESAEVATPAAEIVPAAEAAHVTEASHAEAPQAVEAPHPVEAAEAVDIPAPAGAAPDNSAFVAMLRARLDALKAAAAAAALEPKAPVAEAAAQPLDVTPQPETSSIESAEVATPAAEIVHAAEAAHAIEAPQPDEAPQTVAAVHTTEVVEAADSPPPAEAAPDNSAFVAMLNARLTALQAAVAQRDAPLEAPQAEATPASQAIHTADVAEAAPTPGTAVTGLHESVLLASLEQMGARPFPPPDEGTAVIFAPKPELEFLPEFAREPMAPAETAPEPEQPVAPQPATEPAATEQTVFAQTAAASQHEPLHAIEPERAPAEVAMADIIADLIRGVAPEPADVEPIVPTEPTAEPAAAAPPADTVATAETTEADFDPADFLFGPEPEPDPAAFLLDPTPPQPPAPRAKPAVQPPPEFAAPPAKPAAENPDASPPADPDPPARAAPEPPPHDPLRALKALSENEKLALFS